MHSLRRAADWPLDAASGRWSPAAGTPFAHSPIRQGGDQLICPCFSGFPGGCHALERSGTAVPRPAAITWGRSLSRSPDHDGDLTVMRLARC